MMKLNNKGMSLIELLVSIILLSVLMLSSFGIVNQLLYIKNNTNIATNNQLNRALIIDTIQNDLVINGLAYRTQLYEGLTVEKRDESVVFKLTSYKGIALITLYKDKLIYQDFSSKENVWNFKNCYSSVDLDLSYYTLFEYNESKKSTLFQINIPIYTKNNTNDGNPNNNINDDIIITYYGKYLRII